VLPWDDMDNFQYVGNLIVRTYATFVVVGMDSLLKRNMLVWGYGNFYDVIYEASAYLFTLCELLFCACSVKSLLWILLVLIKISSLCVSRCSVSILVLVCYE
jgi:hypothetical protein